MNNILSHYFSVSKKHLGFPGHQEDPDQTQEKKKNHIDTEKKLIDPINMNEHF